MQDDGKDGKNLTRWMNWRDYLPRKYRPGDIPAPFHAAIEKACEKYHELLQAPVQEGRMALVCSVYNAKDVLPQTLKEMVQQMHQAEVNGEIFIILNNGGGDTGEYLLGNDRLQTSQRLVAELNLDRIIYGKAEFTAKDREQQAHEPCEVFLEEDLPLLADGICLIVIMQEESTVNKGKIRALRDLYSFLADTPEYSPQYLFAFDAETRLRPVSSGHVIDRHGVEGLKHMMEISEGGQHFVGARIYLTPYGKDGDPDWQAQIPAMQKSSNLLHGTKHYQYLAGGAILGGYAAIVAIMAAITRIYSGVRGEDSFMTCIARACGIHALVDTHVVHTNRCPYVWQKDRILGQMVRWEKSNEGMRNSTGKISEEIIYNSTILNVWGALVQMLKAKESFGEMLRLVRQGLLNYILFVRIPGLRNPDDCEKGEGSWD